MHLKRTNMPNSWPVKRKGIKYVVRPISLLSEGIPLLIALRDVLDFATNRRDVKNILKLGKVKINNKIVKDDKQQIILFDILTIDNKSYKLVFKNKKFGFDEIKSNESEEKLGKVIGKKLLNKNQIQINLNGGRNYITKEKIKINDSVLIDLKENKIKEILPFKQGSNIVFISGKHTGEQGKVEEIDEENKIIKVKVKNDKISSKISNLMVVR